MKVEIYERDEGTRFKHVLTGDPRGVVFTRMAVERLLSSELLTEPK